MKLSRSQKKLWLSVVGGFAAGALTALQGALAPGGLTEHRTFISLLALVAGAGIVRAAGVVLAWIETADPKPPPPPAAAP